MGCIGSKGTAIESRDDCRPPPPPPPPSSSEAAVVVPRPTPSPSFLGKSYSFHVFEKPDASPVANEGKAVFRTGSMMTVPRTVEIEGIRPLRENFFIMRDRMEMERAGKVPTFDKRSSGGVRQTTMGPSQRTGDDCVDRVCIGIHDQGRMERRVARRPRG